MNYKKCEILLVSTNLIELKYWIELYKNSMFEKVEVTNIRECFFTDVEKYDYRANVQFYSKMSKNDIYRISNQIKANPIKFSKV